MTEIPAAASLYLDIHPWAAKRNLHTYTIKLDSEAMVDTPEKENSMANPFL